MIAKSYSYKKHYVSSPSGNTKMMRYYFYTFFLKVFYFLLVVLSIIIINISIMNKNFDLLIRNKILTISKPIFFVAETPFNLLFDFIISVKNLTLTYIINNDLKQENIALKKLYLESLEMKIENENLKQMLNFIDEININYHFITSKVYLSTKNNMENTLTLNIGSSHGIQEGNLVLGKRKSVIGRTINIRENNSDVLLLTDINSKIPVYTLNTNERLILSGSNGNYLQIDFFNSKNPNLVEDDLVYTSGDSNIIPNGLYVGKIKKIKNKFMVETDEEMNKIFTVMIIIPKIINK